MTRRLSARALATISVVAAVLAPITPARADSVRDRQWHLTALDVAAAHKISTGKGVTVAVIDSGVDATHPDLAGNVLPGKDLTGQGGDGRVDENGHGTSMAGLIAAHGHGPGNRDGALGIAPDAKIVPIRDGVGSIGIAGSTATGIQWAITHGASIISISEADGASAALRQAVQEALDHNIVVVAGVGNRPSQPAIAYPARYPGVIAVGASNQAGELATVSLTGREMVLLAPGNNITSTNRAGGYRTGTGTSDSTAIVAGAAALIRAKYPNATAAEVFDRLAGTATDKGSAGRDPQYGYGVLDLKAALTATNVPRLAPGTATSSATASVSADSPSATAETPISTRPAAIEIRPVVYVILAVLLVLGLAVVGLLIWLVARRRRT